MVNQRSCAASKVEGEGHSGLIWGLWGLGSSGGFSSISWQWSDDRLTEQISASA
jgi:hypothetical protein